MYNPLSPQILILRFSTNHQSILINICIYYFYTVEPCSLYPNSIQSTASSNGASNGLVNLSYTFYKLWSRFRINAKLLVRGNNNYCNHATSQILWNFNVLSLFLYLYIYFPFTGYKKINLNKTVKTHFL